MYTLLSKEYSQIFPLDTQRVSLAKALLTQNSSNVLDIGSATGDFAYALAKEGYQVTAWEPEKAMVQIARSKQKSFIKNPLFEEKSMLDLDEIDQYGGIFCLGNTVVHLQNVRELEMFMKKAFLALESNGFLLVQLLNYEKILNEKTFAFPTIETEELIFQRQYSDVHSESVCFHIQLENRKTRELSNGMTILYPFLRQDLFNTAMAAGFAATEFFKNLDREKLDGNETHYYFLCRKES